MDRFQLRQQPPLAAILLVFCLFSFAAHSLSSVWLPIFDQLDLPEHGEVSPFHELEDAHEHEDDLLLPVSTRYGVEQNPMLNGGSIFLLTSGFSHPPLLPPPKFA